LARCTWRLVGRLIAGTQTVNTLISTRRNPAASRTQHGFMVRTPLDGPDYGKFERYGIAIGDSQYDSTGNTSSCYAWGRHWCYCTGGKVYSWADGETKWRSHTDHIPKEFRNGGYAGTINYNPIRDEVYAIGSQYFGDGTDEGWRALVVRGPDLPAERLDATLDGEHILGIASARVRMTYHPVTGDYLMLHSMDDVGRLLRSTDGAAYTLSHLFDSRDEPWGNYECYMTWTPIPNTDLIVCVSHVNGVLLHKVLP
jgi:hypothetical protein